MRLIDADSLLVKVVKANPMGGMIGGKFIEDLIKQEPTAYDVDEVVGELEEEYVDIVTEGDPTPIHHWNRAIDKAIEIVKGGGQG